MSSAKASLRYFVLGLLARQPMSGYDIKRFVRGLSWLIGSPSSGSLYPALRSLLEEDLVSVEIVPGVDKPPRKIYSIEQAGRDALQEWLDKPLAADASLKTFMMRLLLADSFSTDSLAAYLQQRRTQVATHQTDLSRMTQSLNSDTDLGIRLAVDYGLELAFAEMAWLENALVTLDGRQ
jgi:PadR family transcriptional regulator, regulatory protein AphA